MNAQVGCYFRTHEIDGQTEPLPQVIRSLPPKYRPVNRLSFVEDAPLRLGLVDLLKQTVPQLQVLPSSPWHDFLFVADQTTFIGDFPGEAYKVLTPITVRVQTAGREFLAGFEEANIAMTGATPSEAVGNLAADILDTYELYSDEEANLGPEPARQLAVLRRHIAER